MNTLKSANKILNDNALNKSIANNLNNNRITSRVGNISLVQTKLTIGQPNDEYEQEADAVADKVMTMPEITLIQRSCSNCQDDEVRTKPLFHTITPLVQRQIVPEEDEQPFQARTDTQPASPSVESSINQSYGYGSSLSDNTRSFMESRFGADFSNVRVHHDSNAILLNRELNAQAFTKGSDIYFNQGKYNPESSHGKHLLAHELTHVVQQTETIAPLIQCHECETSSIHPCSGANRSVVTSAFEQAASWLPQAQTKMQDYIADPSARANRSVASILRRHFNWSEHIRTQSIYPDIPRMLLDVINNSMNNISVTNYPHCPPGSARLSPTGDEYAGSPRAWEGTNCYEYYPLFFTPRARRHPRGKIVIHEMMHSWETMDDVTYEDRDDYPPGFSSAQNNADSYAAAIRDLGNTRR